MFLRSDGELVITSYIKRSTVGPLKKGTILGGPYYLMLRVETIPPCFGLIFVYVKRGKKLFRNWPTMKLLQIYA
jgi:hypothetical protein